MEQLPTEVMVHAMAFMDIATRIQLARCNTTLQHRVFRDCSQAWAVIDFEHVTDSLRLCLTDHHLANLLERVNARENTVKLNLKGCAPVQGEGLEPLRYSRVMQVVSLDPEPFFEASDPELLMSILETMIPYNIQHVSFSRAVDFDLPEHRELFNRFCRLHRHAIMLRALENGTKCEACRLPVMEESRQVVGAFNTSCESCGKHFCRRSCCSMSVRVCADCKSSYCQACNKCIQCVACGAIFCERCDEYRVCTECGTAECEFCKATSTLIMERCSSCDEMICENCGTRQQDCSNECLVCQGCSTIAECAYCQRCSGIMQCDWCSKRICADHCGCVKEKINRCGGCKRAFCLDCRACEQCGLCDERFCNDHGRLVDCDSCQLLHCYHCPNVKRCKLCARACFEECVCEDKKPAAKRQKVSHP